MWTRIFVWLPSFWLKHLLSLMHIILDEVNSTFVRLMSFWLKCLLSLVNTILGNVNSNVNSALNFWLKCCLNPSSNELDLNNLSICLISENYWKSMNGVWGIERNLDLGIVKSGTRNVWLSKVTRLSSNLTLGYDLALLMEKYETLQ